MSKRAGKKKTLPAFPPGTIVVVLRGGCVEAVYAPPVSTVVIVDWDNIEDDDKTHGCVIPRSWFVDMPDATQAEVRAGLAEPDA
jgi:hypothetical protein